MSLPESLNWAAANAGGLSKLRPAVYRRWVDGIDQVNRLDFQSTVRPNGVSDTTVRYTVSRNFPTAPGEQLNQKPDNQMTVWFRVVAPLGTSASGQFTQTEVIAAAEEFVNTLSTGVNPGLITEAILGAQ